MRITSILKSLCLHPKILLKSDNIFLISHMRGNTSLLSHLLGNHSEIEGYYEMHIGYYSWKSLFRQKLLYLEEHSVKKSSHYYFDKILHNEHYIDQKILQQSKIIIMLREPEQSIRSIMNLYLKIDPSHPFCQEKNASQYYIERLQEIHHLAQQIPNKFYYLQAEDLRQQTEKELLNLQKFLNLNSLIPTEYKNFTNTGKEKYGDSSNNITTGKVQKKETDYSDITITKTTLALAEIAYKETVAYCKKNTIKNS